MTYNSKQDILGNFIVIDNGYLDEARIELEEQTVRTLMLKQFGREIGSTCVTGAISLAKATGHYVMELFDEAAKAGA